MTLLSRPVFDAVSSSRDAEAKALLAIDHGANPSKEVWPRNETLAHRASAFGSVLLLEAAKEHGVDFSAKDDDGRTPLHLAVNGNCPPKQAAVDFLIEQCVNLDEVDGDGAGEGDRRHDAKSRRRRESHLRRKQVAARDRNSVRRRRRPVVARRHHAIGESDSDGVGSGRVRAEDVEVRRFGGGEVGV